MDRPPTVAVEVLIEAAALHICDLQLSRSLAFSVRRWSSLGNS